MSGERDDNLRIAVALTRLSVQFEDADPELAERARQLAADRLLKYDITESDRIVDELEAIHGEAEKYESK